MVFLVIIIFLYVLSLLIFGIKIKESDKSDFEINRLAKAGDSEAKKTLEIMQFRPYFNNFMLFIWILVIGIYSYFIFVKFNLIIGVVLLIVSSLFYPLIYNKIIKNVINQDRLLIFLYNIVPFFKKNKNKLFLFKAKNDCRNLMTVDSVEDLIHTLKHSNIDQKYKNLAIGGILLKDKKVSSVMTSREHIISVEYDELMGPLVLDELHKTEHSHFPVINKDLNHIIGILDITDLLTLSHKRSLTAKNVAKNVYYIYDDQTIIYAFKKMIDFQQTILIVINHDKEPVGIIALKDIFDFIINSGETN